MDMLCPQGKVALGGGARSWSVTNGIVLNGSYPINGGWRLEFTNRFAQSISVVTYVVCVTLGS
jgi:hypothetical protein